MEQLHDELGITTSVYQKQTGAIVEEFLVVFGDAAKRTSSANRPKQLWDGFTDNDTPFSIRLNEKPPSVQIIQHPKGGEEAGVRRIKNKMIPPEFQNETTASGIVLPNQCITPESAIAIAEITDLTRELILVTLDDKTVIAIMSQGLLRPEEVSQLLKLLQQKHPEHFVIVQRYLLGVESEYDCKVPFSVIPSDDRETFQYLTDLPSRLI